ncbi:MULTISPECIES: EamA family transporter [Isoptericola]|uniref:EamA family transporter n=1 Tax=Isoptericola sediminis TaxID=2733572 RepID=A0A849JSM4_9MICO|nr:EamA family transporter [Isoptericola sp. b515]MDO8147931.1 EamA family transporter [Isoptericola sp. b515]NNU26416.1 EamA family transporter [Isoptericola sediminis]
MPDATSPARPGPPPSAARGAADRVPAPLLFVASGLTLYLGAAVAVGLFGTLGAPTVSWWRILLAAVVLVAWRRPWRRRWTRQDLVGAGLFGVALAAMNIVFYVAIDHLPLGVAVAIEFTGPIAVAAITGRGWRERGAIVVAAAGVVLLAGVTLEGDLARGDAIVGLVAVLGAAACWAGYIVLGKRVAGGGAGIDGLAVGMVTGAVVFAPFFATSVTTVVPDLRLLGFLLVVAVCSSVVPYVLDQLVLRRIGTATFSVLLALLPATATVVGAVVLGQLPSWPEIAGLVLVSGAIAMTATGRE